MTIRIVPTALALALVGVLALGSCGKKGDPVPPSESTEKPADDG